ncbi:MAG TPA: hypothetical protein PLG97_04510 [Alcaligenes sp.]|nr:hypothetical protein [Alcaligenes sp.]
MALPKENPRTAITIPQCVTVALSAAGTFLILFQILKFSSYGLDFTDESFYLNWISTPYLYKFSLTQFGYIYHPLYLILDGDIANLRRANLLITFFLSWALVYIYLSRATPLVTHSAIILHSISAGLACSSLLLFDTWLLTPSYNSLALQALLVTSIGLILAEKSLTRISVAGFITLGLGGWMAFMAKPSTALALAIITPVYLLLARKFSLSLIFISIFSAIFFLVTSSLLIDGNIASFINRFQVGLDFARYLGGGHTPDQIIRLEELILNDEENKLIFYIFSVSFFIILFSWLESHKSKITLISTPLLITIFLLIPYTLFNFSDWSLSVGKFQNLLIFGIIYAIILASLLFSQLRLLLQTPLTQWAAIALWAVMPYIYAFGSNGNYWQVGSSAIFFWLIAAFTLLAPLARKLASWAFAVPLVLVTQALIAALLQTGLERPYRQPGPLHLNETALEIGPQRSTLILSSSYADYLSAAIKIAYDAGFQPQTPVIDLSGQSPGVLYALGAYSIGQAWMIGGYPGSPDLAKAALLPTPCQNIAAAWLLVEPTGPRHLPTTLLSELGMNFPQDYERVGAWQTAPGAGGYTEARTQELYRPLLPNDAETHCRTTRAKEPK